MTSFTTSESTVFFRSCAGQRERIEAKIIYVSGNAFGGRRDGLVGLIGKNRAPRIPQSAADALRSS